ncbi:MULTISPECIES: M10 family metallopeptidase C-terminal domain-containing protein [Pseudomonas]|uniref:M10 family metallopeptidase C-terminal domain-containing protein n=1 Tax=Pseudomonas rhodesiae TaxID=76760 RepID=A0A8I1JES2_9PSED|nr:MULTISPECIES: M10 family metallopeptidase C-terminal domain-containing protein [Pseudomonas]MBI6604742.1 M10 family metallopeptidase C-terminal domain-containing protein [Pseudomonas sp. S4_EA_1b]MBI6626342.1 M10 family metallopeptidase C-terminal domain-containing protein [Pseudomonas rhodesiae]NMY79785.1 hypothetical protein [Pseudomonas rhodesiae]
MLTIPPQWANRPTASQPAHASASPAQLTPERLNALLRSGPRWSASAKPPEPTRPSPAATAPGPALPSAPEAKLTEDLSDLNTALTQDNINQMVRDPDAESSRALIARTRALLTPANMRTMLGGPNASTNAATLEGLRQRLGKQVLTETQQSASNDAEQELIDQMKLHLLENLGKIYDGGLGTDEILKDYNMSRKHIDAIKRDQSAREASVRTLYDIGGSLSKEKLSALRTPEPASATAQVAERLTRQRNTYRFNALSDSRLDAPREISGFMAGDKLDLSGIRNQLNKPLQRVERFSGASAEMQIHYLPSTGTSVIAVSGNPGEPPFVLKVFGQVRYSDIVS